MAVRVLWDGAEIPGVCSAGPLRRSTSVLELRDGGSPWLIRKSPELTRNDPVTMERELGPDLSFQAWAELVTPFPSGPTPEPPSFRKEVGIEFVDRGGTLLVAYRLLAAWPAGYEVSDDDGVARERLTLVHEGFVRVAPAPAPYLP